MDELGNLRAFVRIVESGSVSAAADQLNIAKSAVSRRLRELERHLGADLLMRSTRALQVTDAGARLYERAVQILADIAEAETEARAQRGQLAGTIRLAAPLSFGALHLGPALAEFRRLYPDITFDVDLNDRIIDLRAVNADLGLRIGRLADSDLIARKLTPIRIVVAASPAFWDRNGRPERPEDLADYDAVHYTYVPGAGERHFKRPDGSQGTVKPRDVLRVNNGDLLSEAAINGMGLCIVPTFIVHDAVREGRLEPVLTDHSWSNIALYALYAPTRHLSPRVRAFIDFLADRFAGVPPWDRGMPWDDPHGV